MSPLEEKTERNNMRIGYLRKDDDSHWYKVPENAATAFDDTLKRIESLKPYSDEWEDAVDNFINAFDDYRLSGGINDVKVLMD